MSQVCLYKIAVLEQTYHCTIASHPANLFHIATSASVAAADHRGLLSLVSSRVGVHSEIETLPVTK